MLCLFTYLRSFAWAISWASLLGTDCLHVVNADNVIMATSQVTEVASGRELQMVLFFSKHDSADLIPLYLRNSASKYLECDLASAWNLLWCLLLESVQSRTAEIFARVFFILRKASIDLYHPWVAYRHKTWWEKKSIYIATPASCGANLQVMRSSQSWATS